MDIKSLELGELSDFMVGLGEPKFRASQIFYWIHKKNVCCFDDMTNLSKSLRDKLKNECLLSNLHILKKNSSSFDNTTKYLFESKKDNIMFESVYMPYNYGNSVCISSQAGCKMGCKICASAVNGLLRNLSAGEMLTQLYDIQKDVNKKISHVVIMGSGEPLDNYFEVLKFIRIVNSKEGQQLSQRHITISTCGLIDKIYELAKQKLQITLAVSLHAPNDHIRQRLMPIAKKYDLDSIIKACEFYVKETGRRVTFEYALINNINDSVNCAFELADRLNGINCHVNLIPLNEVSGIDYKKSTDEAIFKFKEILDRRRINSTVRRKLGSDVNGACGQLYSSLMKSFD